MFLYYIRNPRALRALLGIGLFIAFLDASIYYHVGSKAIISSDISSNYEVFFEWVGLAFFVTAD